MVCRIPAWRVHLEEGMEDRTMDRNEETITRQKRATARFMLRVIAADQAHGVVRPDADAFKTKMEQQAKED